MKLDRKKMTEAIKSTAAEIKELKKLQRESLQPRFGWKENSRLRTLKWEANRLCTLIAHSRKHIHKQGMTLEEQAELVGDGLMAFALPEAAVA